MEKRPLRRLARPPPRRFKVAKQGLQNSVVEAAKDLPESLTGVEAEPTVESRFVVRSAEILTFVIVDGVVHYKINVQATEGRHWTVVKRYSDFRVLEQNTWQMRGPMPPFPYSWEGLQIVLHLVEPVIQRKRRLEAKKEMLDDWLARLVARARRTISLQKHVSLFVEVDNCFEGADSLLLLNANNVTSLVVSNPQATVETILLKLSTNVDHMASARGKVTLHRAHRWGPDSAVKPTPADLDQDPPLPLGLLVFDLSSGVPTVRLRVLNRRPRNIAFKVMATEPTRYFVTPATTTIGGGRAVVVSIFMPDGFDPSERFLDGQDRFMFISTDLADGDDEVEEGQEGQGGEKEEEGGEGKALSASSVAAVGSDDGDGGDEDGGRGGGVGGKGAHAGDFDDGGVDDEEESEGEEKTADKDGTGGGRRSTKRTRLRRRRPALELTPAVWQSFNHEQLRKQKLAAKFVNRPDPKAIQQQKHQQHQQQHSQQQQQQQQQRSLSRDGGGERTASSSSPTSVFLPFTAAAAFSSANSPHLHGGGGGVTSSSSSSSSSNRTLLSDSPSSPVLSPPVLSYSSFTSSPSIRRPQSTPPLFFQHSTSPASSVAVVVSGGAAAAPAGVVAQRTSSEPRPAVSSFGGGGRQRGNGDAGKESGHTGRSLPSDSSISMPTAQRTAPSNIPTKRGGHAPTPAKCPQPRVLKSA